MKNYLLAVFMVLCLSSVFGQDFLYIREDASRREKVEMEVNSAEAVFIAETSDITITTSNKSVDLVSSPVQRKDGKYEYVVILDIGEGHFDRHFTVEKKGTSFRTTTKKKNIFAQGDRRYFIVEEPKVKFMLTQPEERVHLAKNEACVEFYSPYPDLRVDTNGLLRARIDTSMSDGGAYVTSVIVNTVHLEKMRAEYQESLPDFWEEITTLTVRFDNSNASSVSVAGLYQRALWRYNIVTVSGAGGKDSKNLRLLSILFSPVEATVRLDGELLPAVHGRADAFVDHGVHNYEIECPYYHSASDSVWLADTSRTVNVTLKPAFGYLKVTGQGVRGATVLVNGKEVGTAPYNSGRLLSGRYTVELKRDLYHPYKEEVQIRDAETYEITTSLAPDYAHVTFAVANNADIFVNDTLVGTGQYIADLRTGSYVVKASREGFTTTVDTIAITPAMMEKVFVLRSPTPLYGLLAIRTRPSKAMVWNKDTLLCKTPCLMRTLIGDYDLMMVKNKRDTVHVSGAVQQRRCLEVKTALPPLGRHLPDSCVKVKMNYVRHPVAYQTGALLIFHFNYGVDKNVPAFGLSVGSLRRFGWTLNLNTNFDFHGFKFESRPEGSQIVDSSYTRLSATVGFVVRTCNVLSLRVGIGASYCSANQKISNQNWYVDSFIAGPQLDVGLAFHLNPLMLTLGYSTTFFMHKFTYNEVRVGLGFCIHKRLSGTPIKKKKDKISKKSNS